MNGLNQLEDLEKNPAARKYDSSSYNLKAYRSWLEEMIPDYFWSRPAIHVAGTKGKGSVCAMIEALLLAANQSTGLFTSPHAHHFGERYRFSGEQLSADIFEQRLEKFLLPWTNSDQRLRPTVFEVLTGLAFREFDQATVDAEIYEVGLGGRLDCTNLITPDVCVITPIGLDHVSMLGNTVEKIALEKAGIMKDSVPVVLPSAINESQNSVRDVLRSHAKHVNAPWYEPYPVVEIQPTTGGQQMTLNRNEDHVSCELNLRGRFQAANWAQAVRAADLFLAKKGTELTDEQIQVAAGNIHWSGRLQYLRSQPAVLVDSAHCPLSAKALGASLADLKKIVPPPYVVLWGMQKDKDHRAFLQALIEGAGRENISTIVTYSMPQPRGASASELHAVARQEMIKCLEYETVEEAFYSSLQLARSGSVLACGTVYSTGRIIELHKNLVAGKKSS